MIHGSFFWGYIITPDSGRLHRFSAGSQQVAPGLTGAERWGFIPPKGSGSWGESLCGTGGTLDEVS